ncbi:hypothetical protein [Eisenbergiella sp.]|nr:hypothetical protein [Eisenbergiella sp.]
MTGYSNGSLEAPVLYLQVPALPFLFSEFGKIHGKSNMEGT